MQPTNGTIFRYELPVASIEHDAVIQLQTLRNWTSE